MMQHLRSTSEMHGSQHRPGAQAGHRPRLRFATACRAVSSQDTPSISRRSMAAVIGVLTVGGLWGAPAQAALDLPNKEMPNSDPYIQELLRRTEEKREERKEQRLKAYYKKNFREYFEYDAGSAEVARRRGIKPETQEKISKWLEENK